MLIVHVHAHVKDEFVEAFGGASKENATHSVQEPGIAVFEVLQDLSDPRHFVLIEIYRDEQAPARHKETAHYAKWRDTVAPMMAEPRTAVKFRAV